MSPAFPYIIEEDDNDCFVFIIYKDFHFLQKHFFILEKQI